MAKEYGVEVSVMRVNDGAHSAAPDILAVEEPLEIRISADVGGERIVRPVSVTMRTPGSDDELAAGFLFTEGIISAPGDIDRFEPWGPRAAGGANTVVVRLRAGIHVDLRRLERHFYTSSSCGVCGKTSIEAIRVCAGPRAQADSLRLQPEVLHGLPEVLRSAQQAFDVTGGLHATALFTAAGNLIAVREDVGRHNAMDKLIGSRLMSHYDMSRSIVLVSGRASFELVQKAAVAGIPVLAAVGAPSSLAVELAAEFDMTLIGFLRDRRFNVYCGAERIANV
jgi:FdhD protein